MELQEDPQQIINNFMSEGFSSELHQEQVEGM